MRFISELLTLAAVGITTTTAAETNYYNTTITPPPNPSATACPTITSTTNLCRTCAIPLCLILSTLTQHCACPNDPTTAFTSHPCESRCQGIGCATSWTIVTATGCPKPSSPSSSKSKSSSPTWPTPSKSKSGEYCETETETEEEHGTKKPYPPGGPKPTEPPFVSTTKVGPTKAATSPGGPTSSLVTSGAGRRAPLPFRIWW